MQSMTTAAALGAALGIGSAVYGQCEQAELLGADLKPFDGYGLAVSMHDGVAIIGAALDNLGETNNVGSAYIYRMVAGEWAEDAKIIPTNGLEDDRFGEAVAVHGDVVVIGSWSDDDPADNAGTAFIYRLDGKDWVEEQKLVASDAAMFDLFGEAVGAAQDLAIIGSRFNDENGVSSGAAYVYRWDGKTWVEESKLLAADGAANDWLGASVSIDGDIAVAGAPQDDDNGNDSGAAYVYRYDGKTWVQEAKLLAADGAAGALFGFSVAVHDDLIAVGASGDDQNGDGAGAAYVFRYRDGVWIEQSKLVASDGAASDAMGFDIDISDDLTIVGAQFADDNGANAGAAYLFRWFGNEWVEEQKLLAENGTAGDRFGGAVSIDGFAALVGASLRDGNGESSGSAYAFELGLCLCNADLNEDGIVGLLDLLQVLSVWGGSSGPEDLDHNGRIDLQDLIFLLSVWGPCV